MTGLAIFVGLVGYIVWIALFEEKWDGSDKEDYRKYRTITEDQIRVQKSWASRQPGGHVSR